MTVRGKHDGTAIPIALDGGTLLRAYREGLAWAPRAGPSPSRRTASGTPTWATTGSRTGRPSPWATASIRAARIPSRTGPTSRPCATISCRSCRSRHSPRSRAVPRLSGGVRREPVPGHLQSLASGPAGPDVHAPVTSNVPVLIFVGRFDPYGSPALARQAARTLRRSWAVELRTRATTASRAATARSRSETPGSTSPTSPPNTSCVKTAQDPVRARMSAVRQSNQGTPRPRSRELRPGPDVPAARRP